MCLQNDIIISLNEPFPENSLFANLTSPKKNCFGVLGSISPKRMLESVISESGLRGSGLCLLWGLEAIEFFQRRDFFPHQWKCDWYG